MLKAFLFYIKLLNNYIILKIFFNETFILIATNNGSTFFQLCFHYAELESRHSEILNGSSELFCLHTCILLYLLLFLSHYSSI